MGPSGRPRRDRARQTQPDPTRDALDGGVNNQRWWGALGCHARQNGRARTFLTAADLSPNLLIGQTGKGLTTTNERLCHVEKVVWLPGTLLGRLDHRARADLMALGVGRSVGPSRIIMAEGAVESHVVLLLDAIAKVTVMLSDGRQALLSVRVSGDIVGETSALNDTPRSATVTTCRPSIIRIIHRTAFRSFLRDHPDGAIEIAGIIADRLRWANARRADFASYPLNVRLIRILCEMARSCGRRVPSGIVVDIGLTQPELATLCGVADVSLQKAVRELRQAGMIGTGYREITILDPHALQQIANLPPSGVAPAG